MELQEPTDFSILAEWNGYPIDPEDAHLGRGWDVMLDVFDRSAMTERRLAALMAPPELRIDRPELSMSSLLCTASRPFFNALRVEARGPAPWPLAGTYAVAIVTDGRGRVHNRHGEVVVSRGDAVRPVRRRTPDRDRRDRRDGRLHARWRELAVANVLAAFGNSQIEPTATATPRDGGS